MADTTFVDGVTSIVASWLNDVNDLIYGILDTTDVSKGDALIPVLQPYTGAVLSNQHQANAQYTFGHQFGIDPTGVFDSTIALQNLVNSKRKPTLELNSVVNVSSVIEIPSDCDLDLNGSTIVWIGPVVDNSNKADKWNNSVFRVNQQSPQPIKYRVAIRNGIINVNDWGCGVSIKQCEEFELSNLEINTAQCAGIVISDSIEGNIRRCKLTNCAANPASGFNPTTDLEGWSDGILIFYGSQNITVENCRIENTRVGTGRCGLCADGTTSAESGRDTTCIIFKNCHSIGYDRAGHIELAYNSGFDNCELIFVDSGIKTFACAVVSWSAPETFFNNCRVISSRALMQGIGGTNTVVNGGNWVKTGVDTSAVFKNTGPILCPIRFNSVNLDFGLGNANLYYTEATFTNCKIKATSYTRSDFYLGGKLSLNACVIDGVGFTLSLGTATDTIESTDCTYLNFTGANFVHEIGATQVVKIHRASVSTGAQIYNDGKLYMTAMDPAVFSTYAGTGFEFIDGDLYQAAAPVAGTWAQGQRVRYPAPSAAGFIGQVCTVAGTPGTWKTYGAISA